MPEFYKKVDGWFDFERFYEKMVKRASPLGAVYVEVGVWQGKSLIFMAELVKELKKPIRLYAVDNWTGGPEVADNIKRLDRSYLQIFNENVLEANCSDLITVIEGDSAESASKFQDNSVDFAFIDAGHSYEAVKADIAAWWPKVVSGGYLAGHDYQKGWGGVMQAVDEFVKENGLSMTVEPGNVWSIRKP